MRAPMTNGLKTVTKQRTEEGSKLLMLAMLPVPKNADSSRKICTRRSVLNKSLVRQLILTLCKLGVKR